jgi:hypothetical protein
LQGGEFGVESGGHVSVGRIVGERGQLEQIVGAPSDRTPCRYLVAQRLGLAQDLSGGALVSPEIRLCGAGIELVDARLLRG